MSDLAFEDLNLHDFALRGEAIIEEGNDAAAMVGSRQGA
jgi:hypothetical protein